MKKVFSLFFVIFFTINSLFAVETKYCVLTQTVDYFPITDESNKSVVTKRDQFRTCDINSTEQGKCLEWEYKTQNFALDGTKYNTYRSHGYEGSMGSVFSKIAMFNNLDHLWSGWKGYCKHGTDEDFSWAENPLFWAGIAMSVLNSGAVQDSSLMTNQELLQQAKTTGLNEAQLANLRTGFGKAYDTVQGGTYLTPAFTSIGLSLTTAMRASQCTVAAGVDIGRDMYDYLKDDGGLNDKDCDPIDEFCDKNTQTTESEIFTVDQQTYEDMVNNDPSIATQIEVLSQENGIVTCRYKNVYEQNDTTEMSMAQTEELRKKIKQTQMAISMAVTTAKMASCIAQFGAGSGPSYGGNSATSGSSMTSSSARSTGSMAISGLTMATTYLCTGAVNPACGYIGIASAVLQVALNFATSFQKIDTCNDLDDAQNAGRRHEKTYKSLKANLCHHTNSKCVKKSLFGGCALTGENYCCYDQLLSKTLVEQIKAQLGRDFNHCTGITMRDMNYISFRECTTLDKQSGFDGAKQMGDYDPKNSFQYKAKCVDLGEFKSVLSAQIGTEIDMGDIQQVFNSMGN